MKITPWHRRICLSLILIFCLSGCSGLRYQSTVLENRPNAPKEGVVSQTRLSMPLIKGEKFLGVGHLAWSPDGKELAATVQYKTAVIFDAKIHTVIRQLSLVSPYQFLYLRPLISYSPDGRYLAAGQGTIFIFDAKTGVKVKELIEPYLYGEGKLESIAWRPDSKSLAALYRDYKEHAEPERNRNDKIAVYDIETGKRRLWIKVTPFHSKGLFTTDLLYHPDGKTLLIGRNNTITHEELKKTRGHAKEFTFIDLIDEQTGQLIKSIDAKHVMSLTALGMTADGQYAASGTHTGSNSSHREVDDTWTYIDNKDPVRLWNISTGQLVREFPVDGWVRGIAISSNNRYLAVNNRLNIPLFDFVTGRLIQDIKLPGSKYFSSSFDLKFSPDNKTLAMSLDKHLYLFHFHHP